MLTGLAGATLSLSRAFPVLLGAWKGSCLSKLGLAVAAVGLPIAQGKHGI